MSQSYAKMQNLYTRLVDSRDGYEQAEERAEGTWFKPMLADLKSEREQFAAAVRADLIALGQDVEDEGSILAGLHRTFLGVRDAVTGNDDDAIKAEIVRGEEKLRDAYDEAIAEMDSAPNKIALNEQKKAVDHAIARVETRQAA